MRKFRGEWAKTAQPFSAVFAPKFIKFGGHVRSPCRLRSFLPIVDIVFRCGDMFGQSSKSVPKGVFAPSLWANARGS